MCMGYLAHSQAVMHYRGPGNEAKSTSDQIHQNCVCETQDVSLVHVGVDNLLLML